jgi:FkbM family methyltransferase
MEETSAPFLFDRSTAKRTVRALMPRAIRPRRILAGPLRGTWLVTSWHDYPAGLLGRTERPLLDWFARHVRPGDTWIDAGAHYGYTAFALARLVGLEGRVFTFEPVASTAGCADRGRVLNGLNQVLVLPFGLSAADTLELRQLPLTRGMADATLCGEDGASLVAAPFVRFDWAWPRINGGNGAIHGMKIDVQGMEADTLEGMKDTLTRWRPRVVLELHAGVSRDRVLTLLGDLGYTNAVPIDPVRGEEKPLFLNDHSYAFNPA